MYGRTVERPFFWRPAEVFRCLRVWRTHTELVAVLCFFSNSSGMDQEAEFQINQQCAGPTIPWLQAISSGPGFQAA